MDYTTYLILSLVVIAFSLWAQGSVRSTYAKYSKVSSKRGYTGAAIAQNILDKNGITDVRIGQVSGTLSDHYSPKEKIIRLSDGVYGSSSVAALGIAAHEAGHTCQHYGNYMFINLRNAILPVAQIGSTAAIPMVVLGVALSFGILVDIGIVIFLFAVLFHLITLPVELNASNRAMKALEEGGYLDDEELKATRKVLTAAAMTYVAALASSLLQFLRLLSIANSRRRR